MILSFSINDANVSVSFAKRTQKKMYEYIKKKHLNKIYV